jgi:hypothetical protein
MGAAVVVGGPSDSGVPRGWAVLNRNAESLLSAGNPRAREGSRVRRGVGFELQMHLGSGAFVSAAGYHHHLAVNVWQGANAAPPPADAVGLREWRIYLPTTADVAATRPRLVAGGAPIHSDRDVDFVTADPCGIPLRVAVDPNDRQALARTNIVLEEEGDRS